MITPSLPESFRTIAIPGAGVSRWRRYLAFAGPGFLVSVGYMDPGNWATDLAGGSRFGYQLLWVILASNLMAILLQTLCARLGLVTGKDLAQACRDYYKKPVAIALWILCEVAIIACDLAEVIGSAVALQLLFKIPLIFGVLLTGFDVLAIFALTKKGFRMLEAVVLTLVVTVAGCFLLEMLVSRPDWVAAGGALLRPTLPAPISGEDGSLFIALGILGATVMPHNLYLHSSIVQTRRFENLKQAIRYNTLDTVLALGAAFFVNAAILVLAAAAFHGSGKVVTELEQAHSLLRPMLGGAAAVAFAVALLASGQSSTITGTLAGQIVMEGFLNLKLDPVKRRLITRGLALIPAVGLILITGGKDTVKLLTFSQVVLSMQLSFAIFPLVMFTSDPKRMGEHASPLWLKLLAWAVCLTIAGLNIKLLFDALGPLYLGLLVFVGLAFATGVKFIGPKSKTR